MGSGGFGPSSLLDGEGCMSVSHLQSCGSRNYSLSEMAYVEDLAKKLAAFGLLPPNRTRASNFTSPTTGNTGKLVGRCPCAACFKHNFEINSRLEAMVRRSEMGHGYGGGTSFKGNVVGRNEVWGGWDFGKSVGRTESPFYRQDFRVFLPVMSQDATCTGRPNVIPRPSQTQQPCTNRPVSFRKKCNGTGVFLPRIATTKEFGTNPGWSLASTFPSPGMIGGGNRLQTPQQLGHLQPELRTIDTGNKVTSCHGRTSPERALVLPQDWTY